MRARDNVNNTSYQMLVAPVVANNDTEALPANGLDTRGADSAELLAVLGNSGDALSGSVKWDLVLEDSDDDTTYAPVTSANDVIVPSDGNTVAPDANGVIATIDAPSEDTKIFRIGYRGAKRYVRIKGDATGTHTNGTPLTVLGRLGDLHHQPV